jgi:predicted phosphodiesterase
MQTKNVDIQLNSQKDTFNLYVIGDVHIGAYNCAERHFRKFVKYIENQPNAYWIGGGDYCNCITPKDLKRFDFQGLADWLLSGSAADIKEQMQDISKQERDRFCSIVEPIKDRCLGLIEGNHEQKFMQHNNNGHHYLMCDQLGVDNLTDCAFVRLAFRGKSGGGKSITVFIMHGMGGGRTAGAEPNHLARLAHFADADIILRGHSHTFRIEPPEIRLCIPTQGKLPEECLEKSIRKANWGCWLKSYKSGPSTYDSRAAYPPRPLVPLEINIKPRHGEGRKQTIIRMSECPYDM